MAEQQHQPKQEDDNSASRVFDVVDICSRLKTVCKNAVDQDGNDSGNSLPPHHMVVRRVEALNEGRVMDVSLRLTVPDAVDEAHTTVLEETDRMRERSRSPPPQRTTTPTASYLEDKELREKLNWDATAYRYGVLPTDRLREIEGVDKKHYQLVGINTHNRKYPFIGVCKEAPDVRMKFTAESVKSKLGKR